MDASEIGVTASVCPGGLRILHQNQYRRRRPGHGAAGRPLDGQVSTSSSFSATTPACTPGSKGPTLGLRLKPSTYQNLLPSGVPFEHAVEMKPGMGSLRVLVVDENSGRMGSVTIPSRALQAANR